MFNMAILALPHPMCVFSATLLAMDAMTHSTRCDKSSAHLDLVALANRYCELIEASGDNPSHWLKDISVLLPRLHAAIVSLDADPRRADFLAAVDLDARFELFSHLRGLLADRDSYWLEFDCAYEGAEAMTGSLADDLTDIYCELKLGLRVFEDDPDDAIASWSSGYERHWRQHLIDAERHLALLGAQSRLEP